MMRKIRSARKRWARGRKRNWDAWAFKADDGSFFHWAEVYKPALKPSPDGAWVKVRFVEVA